MKSMVLNNIPTLDYASIEAFNTLATNVTFAGSQCKVIMMTSCVANEGKSYVAVNLVRRLANMGYRMALVDADLRKSVFSSRYGVQTAGQAVGLTHYLAGRARMEDIIYKTNLNNVFVIPIGKEVINSLPLLSSASFTELLDAMRSNFDFVIVDSPPIGLLIDAAMVASACDATILVVTNERITRRELVEAKQQIEKSGCMLLGTVMNKVTMDTHKSRKYYYKSYYSHYGTEDYTMKPVKQAEDKPAQTAAPQPHAAQTQHARPEQPPINRAPKAGYAANVPEAPGVRQASQRAVAEGSLSFRGRPTDKSTGAR